MSARHPPIGLRYFAPAPDLAEFVSSYYLFHADLPHVADMMRADLGQIRFMVSGRGTYLFGSGVSCMTPDVTVLGPTTAPTRFDVIGPVMVFGIALLPAGWSALVREDASQMADRLEDASAVFNHDLDNALDAMRTMPTPEVMVAIGDALVRRLARRARAVQPDFTSMVDSWLTGHASPSIDYLVANSDLSIRQVERLTRRIYGASPKLLARKYRALRSASLLSAGEMGWADAAGDAFFDQSHFIREIKQFTGMTPRQLTGAATPLTRLTMRRRMFNGRVARLGAIS